MEGVREVDFLNLERCIRFQRCNRPKVPAEYRKPTIYPTHCLRDFSFPVWDRLWFVIFLEQTATKVPYLD
jgi:hypothetical protein